MTARDGLAHMKQALAKPLPVTSGALEITIRLGVISLLVWFIFSWARPEIAFHQSPPLNLALGIELALAAFLTALALRLFLVLVLRPQQWTVGWEILFYTGYFSAIATVLLTILVVRGHLELSPRQAVLFLLITPVLGGIPVVFEVQLAQNRLLKRALAQAKALDGAIQQSQKAATPTLEVMLDTTRGRPLILTRKNFSHARAGGNYCEIFINTPDGLRVHTIRYVFTSLVEKTAQIDALRVHRSWLVNPDKIDRIEADARGCRIILSDYETPVPVSRRFRRQFFD